MRIFQQIRRQARSRRTITAKPAQAEATRAAMQEVLGYPVQTKLTLGAPDDAHERDADAVADHVMRLPAQAVPDRGAIRRKCAACQQEDEEHKRNSHSPETGEKKDDEIHAKAMSLDAGAGGVAPETASRISKRRGGGIPLPAGEQAFFEHRMGADLEGVRIHADGEAARLSAELGAHAFTIGNDIFFGENEYRPGSAGGRRLLAHELAHVLQQDYSKRAGAKTSGKPALVQDGSTASAAQAVPITQGTAAPTIMRSVIFSSTIDIRFRQLTSRRFSVSKESIQVTADAGYPNPATCGAGGYDVDLIRKGLLWNSSMGSRHFPNGRRTTHSWSGLEAGKTYYLVITVPQSRMRPNVCALIGSISVEE